MQGWLVIWGSGLTMFHVEPTRELAEKFRQQVFSEYDQDPHKDLSQYGRPQCSAPIPLDVPLLGQ